MTSLGNKTKHTRPKAFVISVGATLVLTAMLSILIFTGNYGINAQTMGAHGGWNTTSGVKDHQQKMIIN
jgi:hypothetical protein